MQFIQVIVWTAESVNMEVSASFLFNGNWYWYIVPLYHEESVNFQWDDDKVRFVLDQHTYLECYSASSPKQQSPNWHVASLEQIIMIQLIFARSKIIKPFNFEITSSTFVLMLNSTYRKQNQNLPHFLHIIEMCLIHYVSYKFI